MRWAVVLHNPCWDTSCPGPAKGHLGVCVDLGVSPGFFLLKTHTGKRQCSWERGCRQLQAPTGCGEREFRKAFVKVVWGTHTKKQVTGESFPSSAIFNSPAPAAGARHMGRAGERSERRV